MTANRSLDEFAAESGDAEAAEAEPADERGVAMEEPATEASATEDRDPGTPAVEARDPADPDTEPPEPVTSTYHWTPDGGPCAVCGDAAEERWRQGDDLVCPACKEW